MPTSNYYSMYSKVHVFNPCINVLGLTQTVYFLVTPGGLITDVRGNNTVTIVFRSNRFTTSFVMLGRICGLKVLGFF
jgi:hypothetical protein